MSERPSDAPPNKLLGLELLRFIAASAVLIWHYTHFSYVADKPADIVIDRLPMYGLLRPFYEAGNYGVWFFWCISGFIFFWKYRDAISDKSVTGWEFFVRRLSRLYPLHLVTLLCVAILQPLYFHLNGYFFVYPHNDIAHFVPQLLLASNWGFHSDYSFNGPIWSISVEVLAYVVFFLTLRFVTKSGWVNILIIVCCTPPQQQIFSCLAFFYIGGLAAIIRQTTAAMTFRSLIERTAWLLMLAAPFLAWIFSSYSLVLLDYAILLYMPLVVFCFAGNMAVAGRLQKTIEVIGNMTYSSYLLQFPIQLMIVLGFSIWRAPIPLYDVSFFLTFITATLSASYLTYRYFEAPAQNFVRDRLLSRHKAAAVIVTPIVIEQ